MPLGNEPGKGILDGVMPLAQQLELQQRAESLAIYQNGERYVPRARLDPVLRAHLGLDRSK